MVDMAGDPIQLDGKVPACVQRCRGCQRPCLFDDGHAGAHACRAHPASPLAVEIVEGENLVNAQALLDAMMVSKESEARARMTPLKKGERLGSRTERELADPAIRRAAEVGAATINVITAEDRVREAERGERETLARARLLATELAASRTLWARVRGDRRQPPAKIAPVSTAKPGERYMQLDDDEE